MKRNTDKNKSSTFKKEGFSWKVSLIWFLVFCVIGIGNKLRNDPCFSLSSLFTGKFKCSTDFVVDKNGSTIPVTIDESKNTIIFGDKTYDVNVSNVLDALKELYDNSTPEQRKYYDNNSTKIQEAVRANSYFISAEYRYFEWCSSYYPTKTFEDKYNQYFSNIKQEINNVLIGAFGRNGLNSLNDVTFKSLKNAFDEQVEEDYNSIFNSLDTEEREYFTKETYCKLLDSYADNMMEEESKNFAIIAPYYASNIK